MPDIVPKTEVWFGLPGRHLVSALQLILTYHVHLQLVAAVPVLGPRGLWKNSERRALSFAWTSSSQMYIRTTDLDLFHRASVDVPRSIRNKYSNFEHAQSRFDSAHKMNKIVHLSCFIIAP